MLLDLRSLLEGSGAQLQEEAGSGGAICGGLDSGDATEQPIMTLTAGGGGLGGGDAI